LNVLFADAKETIDVGISGTLEFDKQNTVTDERDVAVGVSFTP